MINSLSPFRVMGFLNAHKKMFFNSRKKIAFSAHKKTPLRGVFCCNQVELASTASVFQVNHPVPDTNKHATTNDVT